MNETKLLYLPIAFRRGGSKNEYGIWFRLAIANRDLLVDPELLCTYELSSPDVFIQNRDEFFDLIIDSMNMTNDWDRGEVTLSIGFYDKEDKDVTYRFERNAFCARIMDSIAALYHWFAVLGRETAYTSLTLGKVGDIMRKMLYGSHPSCRETAVPPVIPETFSFRFQESEDLDVDGQEKQLDIILGIENRSYDFQVDRYSFLHFNRLRHDLENIIYHGEARLEIDIYWSGMNKVIIMIERVGLLDETIPLTIGSNGRYRPAAFVSIQTEIYEEKQTEIIGFCDLVPTLREIYRTLSEIAGHYENNTLEDCPRSVQVCRKDFQSASFVNYLRQLEDDIACDDEEIRNHYAFAGYEMYSIIEERRNNK